MRTGMTENDAATELGNGESMQDKAHPYKCEHSLSQHHAKLIQYLVTDLSISATARHSAHEGPEMLDVKVVVVPCNIAAINCHLCDWIHACKQQRLVSSFCAHDLSP